MDLKKLSRIQDSAVQRVKDSMEEWTRDEAPEELQPLFDKFDEWSEQGYADGYSLYKDENGEVVLEEVFVDQTVYDDVNEFMSKAGYENTDNWSTHDSEFTSWKKKEVIEDSVDSLKKKVKEWDFCELRKKKDGTVVYTEDSDVEESHVDEVREEMEKLGYKEVDTDNHHDTYYYYYQK